MLSWDLDSTNEAKSLLSFYKHLIEFRKSRPAMRGRTRDTLRVLSSENGVICFERHHENDYLLIVLNFNKEIYTYTNKSGHTLRSIFDGGATSWGGPVTTGAHTVATGNTIDLQPQSALIFEK